MMARNWKHEPGKAKHFNQSLFDHTLVVLDSLTALLPLLRRTGRFLVAFDGECGKREWNHWNRDRLRRGREDQTVITQEELDSFHRFASGELRSAGADLTLADLLDRRRMQYQTP